MSVPGIFIGLFLSMTAAQLGRAMLLGISPFAAAATLLPAIRTSRIDLLATLRRH